MSIDNLPYLPRPALENELQKFLCSHLSPRANSTKALLLNGERGVGKRALLNHCLSTSPELKQYFIFTLDFSALALNELIERNQKLKEKSLDSVVEVVKESSPYLLKLALGVLHLFMKDQLFKAQPREKFETLPEIEDFLFLLIEQQAVLLIIENFDRDNTEHIRSLAHLANMSYQRAVAFALILIDHASSAYAQETLKNLQRFLRHDDHLRGLNVAPLTPEECGKHLTNCGISSAWAQTLHRFSEGYLGPLKFLWQNLQTQGLLQKVGSQYVARDEPQYVLTRDFVRAWLRKMLQRRQHEITLEFYTPLDDALLLAAAMGETFLPQAAAEAALPRKRKYSPDEIAAWEDLWYDVLEEESEDRPALAAPVQENGENKTLTGEKDRRFFVYAFHDRQWQPLLQHLAKQLCEPIQVDQPLYDSLVYLEEWLHAYFQENWEQVLPYRIAVNRTLRRFDAAHALEKLQRLQKLRVDLPQQLAAERKRVSQGLAAGGLYQLLLWYCEVLQENGMYPEALDAMYEAHTLLLQQKIQLTDLELAGHLNALGFYYRLCGEYEEAEPLFRRSLAIWEKQLGPKHPSVATSLNNLAALLFSQGKYSEAEPLYRRSLAISEQQLGPEHPDVARSMNNLAALLHSRDKSSEAEPLYRHSLAIREQQLGPEHPDVASSLSDLAVWLLDQGKYSEAEPLLRRSLAIREQQLGPEHPDVAESLGNLVRLLRAQGKYSETEPLLRRSLAIHEQQLGPEHPSVATSLNNLAVWLRAQGKYYEAEPLYRRAVEILEKSLGPEHPNTQAVQENYAHLLAEMKASGS